MHSIASSRQQDFLRCKEDQDQRHRTLFGHPTGSFGQVDDLGGGVFKKRLNSNLHRTIILAKGGKYWIYEYLFAKKDREKIQDDELIAFRLLTKAYAGLTQNQVGQLLTNGDFVEICRDDKTEI